MVCMLMIIMISCQKDEFKPNRETGKLHLNIGLSIRINEIISPLKAMPLIEEFNVNIFRADGTEILSFENVSDIPDTIELEIGNYYVEAYSDNNLPAEFDNPYYSGVSNVFPVNPSGHQSVQVNCEIANSLVSVNYSDNVRSNFTYYRTVVSSSLDSLVFLMDETRLGYFQPLPLDIKVELTYLKPDGSDTSKLIAGQIPDPLPNRHYEIFVDASIDNGMASFLIMMDSTEVEVVMVNLGDPLNPPTDGTISYGELLITEIMPNPSALSDTEGEWFEIYNNSDRVLNLQNLAVGRDDVNFHIITDSIDVLPGTFIVFSRTDLATDATSPYIYGSGILLSNTGAVLSIYNEGPETDPGALIFSVDYGSSGFPVGTGESITLNPNMLNAADAVLGTSWCLSTTAYSTGDLGTPGLVNDSCQ